MKVKFCDESRIYFGQGDNVHSIKITICTVLRKEKKNVASLCMVKHEGHAQIGNHKPKCAIHNYKRN